MNSGADWGIGGYEVFAPALAASAQHLVQLAAPQTGERAVDLGCGTGNATLPLLESGATVTAIDPSLRLLGIASKHAHDAGFQLSALAAGAESLPLPDGDADLIVSNFGVIFCPDAPAAFAEVVRVLTPGGRFLYSAWLPTGPISEVAMLIRRSANASAQPAIGEPEAAADPRAAAWHEPSSFAHLIPGGEDAITVHSAETTFVAKSGEDWFTIQETHHPMWLLAQQSMPASAWAEVREHSIAILEAGSTEGEPFGVASPYVVIEIRPQR